jgi:hypothetical protein
LNDRLARLALFTQYNLILKELGIVDPCRREDVNAPLTIQGNVFGRTDLTAKGAGSSLEKEPFVKVNAIGAKDINRQV